MDGSRHRAADRVQRSGSGAAAPRRSWRPPACASRPAGWRSAPASRAPVRSTWPCSVATGSRSITSPPSRRSRVASNASPARGRLARHRGRNARHGRELARRPPAGRRRRTSSGSRSSPRGTPSRRTGSAIPRTVCRKLTYQVPFTFCTREVSSTGVPNRPALAAMNARNGASTASARSAKPGSRIAGPMARCGLERARIPHRASNPRSGPGSSARRRTGSSRARHVGAGDRDRARAGDQETRVGKVVGCAHGPGRQRLQREPAAQAGRTSCAPRMAAGGDRTNIGNVACARHADGHSHSP